MKEDLANRYAVHTRSRFEMKFFEGSSGRSKKALLPESRS